jgi:hypothetical protein
MPELAELKSTAVNGIFNFSEGYCFECDAFWPNIDKSIEEMVWTAPASGPSGFVLTFVFVMVGVYCSDERLESIAIMEMVRAASGSPTTFWKTLYEDKLDRERSLIVFCLWLSNAVLREKLLITTVLMFIVLSSVSKNDGGTASSLFVNGLGACFILEVDELLERAISYYLPDPEMVEEAERLTERSSEQGWIDRHRGQTTAVVSSKNRQHAHASATLMFMLFIVIDAFLIVLVQHGDVAVGMWNFTLFLTRPPLVLASMWREAAICWRAFKDFRKEEKVIPWAKLFRVCVQQFCFWSAEWFWFILAFTACYISATNLAFIGASSRIRSAVGFYVSDRLTLQLCLWAAVLLIGNGLRMGVRAYSNKRAGSGANCGEWPPGEVRASSAASDIEMEEARRAANKEMKEADPPPGGGSTPYRLMRNDDAGAGEG